MKNNFLLPCTLLVLSWSLPKYFSLIISHEFRSNIERISKRSLDPLLSSALVSNDDAHLLNGALDEGYHIRQAEDRTLATHSASEPFPIVGLAEHGVVASRATDIQEVKPIRQLRRPGRKPDSSASQGKDLQPSIFKDLPGYEADSDGEPRGADRTHSSSSSEENDASKLTDSLGHHSEMEVNGGSVKSGENSKYWENSSTHTGSPPRARKVEATPSVDDESDESQYRRARSQRLVEKPEPAKRRTDAEDPYAKKRQKVDSSKP